MGFLRKFRELRDESIQKENENIRWRNLVTMDQLEEIKLESNNALVAIFKHSTRCGVSRGVLKTFEKEFSLQDDQINLYFLDLLAHRDISNAIASKFKIPHESPQLIVLKKGEVVYAESHNSIDASALGQFV